MKKLSSIFVLLCALSSMAQDNNVSNDYNQYVNPIIGTNGMGHTFPGACYPYGAVQLSPDTDTIPHNIDGVYQPRVYEYCAGYQYRDSSIVGFSHRHFSGTGHSDLGDILIMPFSGEVQLNPGTADNPDSGYRQRFSHDTEVSVPGYYAVTLSDDDIKCELTASQYSGLHRYTFPEGAEQKIVLDLNHGIYNYDGKVLWAQANVYEDNTLIKGYRITNGWSRVNYVYFAIRFNKRIANFGCEDFGKNNYNGFWKRFDCKNNFPEMGGRKLVSYFEFEDDGDNVLEICVSLSPVSAENALDNLNSEMKNYMTGNFLDDDAFDEVCKNTKSYWNQMLSKIEMNGSDDQKAMLYTSLYHTMINPSIYDDNNGWIRGIDQDVHKKETDFTNYTIFSVWDTYRAFHPLINLIDEELSYNIVESFKVHSDQSPHGMLPVWSHMGNENWCMIGYHGVSVIADALTKNVGRKFTDVNFVDYQRDLVNRMVKSSNVPYYDFTDLYKEIGYVPVDKSGNGVSITLENAYEDWCVYNSIIQVMDNAGEDKSALQSLADQYYKRAMSYRNVFDTTIGFARARYSDGSWKEPFSTLSTHGEGFIEGNAWNYSFYVPHDVNGLVEMMGGDDAFIAKLDTLFTMHVPDEFFAKTEDVTREGMFGGYVHGNEPSHHIPYLYAWTSEPWKSQYWVRQIMNEMYKNNIDGLCGNDDCGQMSAWYIFSAMGFYPVCPGSDQYVFGAPYLPYMKVTLGSGKVLEIIAKNVSDKNCYIKSIKFNGQPINRAYITHDELVNGGVLEFVMSSKPNKKLFVEKPYSLSE